MATIEAELLLKKEGCYEDEEMEDVLRVYDELAKHIGFKDNRRDSRYVVKFHDIFWHTPEEYINSKEFEWMFNDFCEQQYELADESATKEFSIDDMLTKQCVGSYRAFVVDIPEITEDNLVELSMQIYDEFNYKGGWYVEDYITVVNFLQDLEDNYMDYWLDFIDGNVDDEIFQKTKESYNKSKEK